MRPLLDEHVEPLHRVYPFLALPGIHAQGFLVQRRSLPYEYCYPYSRGSFSPSVRSTEMLPVSECPSVQYEAGPSYQRHGEKQSDREV
jgi:hypothetical protein